MLRYFCLKFVKYLFPLSQLFIVCESVVSEIITACQCSVWSALWRCSEQCWLYRGELRCVSVCKAQCSVSSVVILLLSNITPLPCSALVLPTPGTESQTHRGPRGRRGPSGRGGARGPVQGRGAELWRTPVRPQHHRGCLARNLQTPSLVSLKGRPPPPLLPSNVLLKMSNFGHSPGSVWRYIRHEMAHNTK